MEQGFHSTDQARAAPRCLSTRGRPIESGFWQDGEALVVGRGTATDLIRDRGSATQDTAGPFAGIYGCTSVSGNMELCCLSSHCEIAKSRFLAVPRGRLPHEEPFSANRNERYQPHEER
jgi:hypothetical protein